MSRPSPKSVVRRHLSSKRVAYAWGPFGEDHEADADGNYMSVQNIKDIHAISGQLVSKIQPGAEMEDWVEDKISTARQIMSDLERFYNKGQTSRDQ